MQFISRASFASLCLFALGAASTTPVLANVRLPAIFSDHMVLQRDANVPVWGWADPGEDVAVTLGGATARTKADANGKWMVRFQKLPVGETLTLMVKGKNIINVQDILVGEVWLGSGQSNMAMTVNRCNNFEQEKTAANFPQIRMFTVERAPRTEPQTDCKGRWEICNEYNVGTFSAAAYFFGREVHQKLGVPVGLINSSYGGTAVEAWTSMEAQQKLSEYATISESWVKATAEPFDQAKADEQYAKQKAAFDAGKKAQKAKDGKAAKAPAKQTDPRLSQNYPANLYNGMIAPIIPYAIRGAIWYQGENNANKKFADIYGLQLATLIKDWRTRWGSQFAFAWVQLPDFRAAVKDPVQETGWVTIREQMLKTLSVPNTGMAVTLGLGEEKDIHPKNKQDVGKRLAAWALADAYKQKDVVPSGPLPAGHKVKGAEMILSFKHAAGLMAKGDVKGFAIAGADKKWVRANAKIEGDKVVVSSPEVSKPVAVRYAWAENPEFSLYNGAGLPATPFRTDDWK